MDSLEFKVLKKGYWLYGTKNVSVSILEISVDFFQELKRFEFEEINDPPLLNNQGLQYLICYGDENKLEHDPFFADNSVFFGGLSYKEALEKLKDLWQLVIWS